MDGKIADRKGYEYMRKLTGAAETAEHNQVRTFKPSIIHLNLVEMTTD
jgi:hypothetical protein